jgi:hypothetical protein
MFKKISKILAEWLDVVKFLYLAEWLAVACLCWLPFAYYFMFILEG